MKDKDRQVAEIIFRIRVTFYVILVLIVSWGGTWMSLFVNCMTSLVVFWVFEYFFWRGIRRAK